MELILKKDSEKIWVFWAHNKAKKAKDFIIFARIKNNGYFYKRDIEIIGEKINTFYSILCCHFENEDIFREERDTLKNHLYTMNTQQFTTFAQIMLDPYIDFTLGQS